MSNETKLPALPDGLAWVRTRPAYSELEQPEGVHWKMSAVWERYGEWIVNDDADVLCVTHESSGLAAYRSSSNSVCLWVARLLSVTTAAELARGSIAGDRFSGVELRNVVDACVERAWIKKELIDSALRNQAEKQRAKSEG